MSDHRPKHIKNVGIEDEISFYDGDNEFIKLSMRRIKMNTRKCLSCAKPTDNKVIFGMCVRCQDYIINQRADDLAEIYNSKIREESFKLDDKKIEIRNMRSDLKVDQAAVELVKLIRSIK